MCRVVLAMGRDAFETRVTALRFRAQFGERRRTSPRKRMI